VRSQFKFLRRVRIHGGECGAVARALHHEAGNFSLPAVRKNVFFTTQERKQMSKKTYFKRIALAVVIALGFGALSSAPVSAAINSDTLTASAATGTATIGGSDTATAATVTVSFLTTSGADSMSVTASLVSGPATNTTLPNLQLVETTSAVVSTIVGDFDSGTAATGKTRHMTLASFQAGAGGGSTSSTSRFFDEWALGSVVASNTAVYVANRTRTASVSATIVSAKFKVFIPSPSVAGSYVIRVTPAISGGSGTLQSSAVNITHTVSAAACVQGCSAPTAAKSWSSMYYEANGRGVTLANSSLLTMAPGDSVINYTSAMTNGITSVQAANILVYQQNADGDIVYSQSSTTAEGFSNANEGGVESMTATISGPGLLAA